MIKVCFATGTRADYGLLSGVMKKVDDHDQLELQVVASCMHLVPEFGNTIGEIEADGFTVDEKVYMLVAGDGAVSVGKSIGLGVIGFIDALSRLSPDVVVILGDRFEALSAAQAALVLRLPIAHIHGGEVTEGALDESIRHAISKMSNLHFVSNESYRKRLIQMGELPDRVFVSGAPGIDNILALDPMSKSELEQSLEFELGKKVFLVTYHPLTLRQSGQELDVVYSMFEALDEYKDVKIILTAPNADEGGGAILKAFTEYAARKGNQVCFVRSLGLVRYLSMLRFVDCVIGNSSSGIIEVPSFNIPTINIGDRQKGRLRSESVIDCGERTGEISSAIKTALSPEFGERLMHNSNPYGNGNAGNLIVETILSIDLKSTLRKPFYDI